MSLRHFNCMSLSLSSLLLSSIFFFISAAASSEDGGSGGFTVDLFHRDSPHLPSYDPSATPFERLRAAVDRSFSRQAALTSAAAAPDSFGSPLTRAGGEYLMRIKIGTPPQEQLAIVDSGSDLTWIQCKPCTKCFDQTLPIFDPKNSSSYKVVTCGSETCTTGGKSPTCSADRRCQYTITYGDRSYTTGELAVETLTFDGGASFPGVAFGCGHRNAGTFSVTKSGVVGLGGGPISIVNQLRASTGARFSYCLASDPNVSGRISFGNDAIVKGPNVVSTPMASKLPFTSYFLTLEGMSVGATRLDYLSSPAANGDDVAFPGNMIIDSGTLLTTIPTELYQRLEEKVVAAVAKPRVADPRGQFKVCYRMEGGMSLPTITAHFTGADLVLPKETTFLEVEKGIFCLTIFPHKILGFFGNLLQINYHVGYDLVKNEVSFLPTDCSKPQ